MFVYRFMSEKEFYLVTSGCQIVGKRYHKCKTSSKGVCFLPEKVNFYSGSQEYSWEPEYCFRFMLGIVSDEVLVKFEVINANLIKSSGIYADPIDDDWYARITIEELCIPFYDREMLRPVAYAINERGYRWKWYSYN